MSAISKNRRLAQLHRLVEAGDYFSDESMRERAPLLHYHYVAQVPMPVTNSVTSPPPPLDVLSP